MEVCSGCCQVCRASRLYRRTIEDVAGGLQRRVVPADQAAVLAMLQDARRHNLARAHPRDGLLQSVRSEERQPRH